MPYKEATPELQRFMDVMGRSLRYTPTIIIEVKRKEPDAPPSSEQPIERS